MNVVGEIVTITSPVAIKRPDGKSNMWTCMYKQNLLRNKK